MWRTILLLALCLGLASNARAIPISLAFTATGFSDVVGPSYEPAPQDPVSGLFVWEADSIHDPIQSLLSVDLSIAGRVYTLQELDFSSRQGQGTDLIGASAANSIRAGTDDFLIQWHKDTLQSVRFAYSSQAVPDAIWTTGNFVNFTVSAPLPSTLWLMLLGLVVVAIRNRYITP